MNKYFIIMTILLVVIALIVTGITMATATNKTTATTTSACTSCGGKCTKDSNCGLASCGAVNGGTCGCGERGK